MREASPFLSRSEAQTIYYMFLEYERWKNEINGFDLMDLVRYILKSLMSYTTRDLRMDFLMIDEVQDLTPMTLELLLKVVRKKAYFAGDTAQTIHKGVGARFSDLRTLMGNFDVNLVQLRCNYRSHGMILELANSVVSLLETIFPNSIDHLAKEVSLTQGPKPLILSPMSHSDLADLFLGKQRYDKFKVATAHSIQKP